MPKVMIFIDGTWLYAHISDLARSYGKEFQMDFGKLPLALCETIQGSVPVDLVRTFMFGSYADNYDLRDEESVLRRLDFFKMLREEHHYEVEIFPINYRGRRLRRVDRRPDDNFEAKEKCVDVSLATALLVHANVYDIAICVIGDQDYKPALQHVRYMGKRVAIASIKNGNSCSLDLSDVRDVARVKDFDIIWLDDLLPKFEYNQERRQLECQSPMHKGDKKCWTSVRLRKGMNFYCDPCRAEFAKQKQAVYGTGNTILRGEVCDKKGDRAFGFIRVASGLEYFFHMTDLIDIDFTKLSIGDAIEFEVKNPPVDGKAGAAKNVRPLIDQEVNEPNELQRV